MEIHEIRYFLALSETLNFTRAAEQCNVTQPALTRAIKGLEAKLGGQLLHRERGNTHLTELGRLMKPYFGELLAKHEAARRRAEDFLRQGASTIRVGLMCTIGPTRLIELFRAFCRNHLGAELTLRDGAAGEIEAALERGDLDVAIYCRPEAPRATLHVLPLYTERFVVAVGPGHRLAGLSEVGFGQLDGLSYLSRANCEYDGTIGRICEAAGVKPRITYQSERDDWIQCMVLAGLGFT
ncbi:MAG TPA: LysR family transcriptional regulator, partial [Paracoccaceae bacterium]|nr:LysR family transcriptional regulator [Paracoccaceae bacterium]